MTEPAHVLVVEARFYEDIADELARGAEQALMHASASYERVAVPGAFELPGAIALALRAEEADPAGRRFDGYVALGCVIRGETTHYEHVCQESVRGLQDLVLRHRIALGFGVLTVENREQALARASVTGRNKGGEAARACLGMIALRRRFGARA